MTLVMLVLPEDLVIGIYHNNVTMLLEWSRLCRRRVLFVFLFLQRIRSIFFIFPGSPFFHFFLVRCCFPGFFQSTLPRLSLPGRCALPFVLISDLTLCTCWVPCGLHATGKAHASQTLLPHLPLLVQARLSSPTLDFWQLMCQY